MGEKTGREQGTGLKQMAVDEEGRREEVEKYRESEAGQQACQLNAVSSTSVADIAGPCYAVEAIGNARTLSKITGIINAHKGNSSEKDRRGGWNGVD